MMMTGTVDKPLLNKIYIILDGAKDYQYLIVSNYLEAGSKVTSMLNWVELFRVVPQSPWTFINTFAAASDKNFLVKEKYG